MNIESTMVMIPLPRARAFSLAAIALGALLSTEISFAAAKSLCASADKLPLTTHAVRLHRDGGPEQLRYEEIARPEPAEGEVLIQTRG